MKQESELHGGVQPRRRPGLETGEEDAAAAVEGGPHARGILDRTRKHAAQEGRQTQRRIQAGPQRRCGTYGSVIGLAHPEEVGHVHPRRGIGGEKCKAMRLRIGARHVTSGGGADGPSPKRQETEVHAPRRRTVDAHWGEGLEYARQPEVVGVIERDGARMSEVHHNGAAVGHVRREGTAVRVEESIVVIQETMQPTKHAGRGAIHPTRVEVPTTKSRQAAWEA